MCIFQAHTGLYRVHRVNLNILGTEGSANWSGVQPETNLHCLRLTWVFKGGLIDCIMPSCPQFSLQMKV